MQTFKVFKTSNIYYRYIYIIISVNRNENKFAIVELFMIMKDRNNEIEKYARGYSFGKRILELILNFEKDLDSFLIEYIKEAIKETIIWEIIYPRFKDDNLFPLFLEKGILLNEIKSIFLLDLWFLDNKTDGILPWIKEKAEFGVLGDLIQNICKIPQMNIWSFITYSGKVAGNTRKNILNTATNDTEVFELNNNGTVELCFGRGADSNDMGLNVKVNPGETLEKKATELGGSGNKYLNVNNENPEEGSYKVVRFLKN